MHDFSLQTIIDFEWDEANRYKNLIKHDVACEEAEQIFNNKPLIIIDDTEHSAHEQRFHAFGRSNDDRKLLICFVVRKTKLRIISARPMSKRERTFYEREET